MFKTWINAGKLEFRDIFELVRLLRRRGWGGFYEICLLGIVRNSQKSLVLLSLVSTFFLLIHLTTFSILSLNFRGFQNPRKHPKYVPELCRAKNWPTNTSIGIASWLHCTQLYRLYWSRMLFLPLPTILL